jgi:hypothetical protein
MMATALNTESNQGAWADGPFVIVRREAELPPRCVCCNAAVAETVPLRVTWVALQPDPQHPLDHIPYLRLIPKIQNMIRDTKALSHPEAAVIRVGLCPTHAARTQFLNALVWLVLPVAALLGVGAAFAHPCFGLWFRNSFVASFTVSAPASLLGLRPACSASAWRLYSVRAASAAAAVGSAGSKRGPK